MAADTQNNSSQCNGGNTPVAATGVYGRRTAYPERLQLRVPAGFTLSVDQAAIRAGVATPEFVRRVLMDALRDSGIA